MKLFSGDKVYSPNERIGEYTVLKVIGEGRYGICYLVCSGENRFILKQLKNRMLRKAGRAGIFEEEILGAIEHERIPRLVSRITIPKSVGYVLEYKEGSTFEEVIYENKYIFERKEIYAIGMQLIRILKYLHAKGIVHRDIRVPNTLYSHGKVYLVDFGLARWIDDGVYRADIDFSFLGDFLLHLYYTSFEGGKSHTGTWIEELSLSEKETLLLKRMLGIEKRYPDIDEIEKDFLLLTTKRIQPSS